MEEVNELFAPSPYSTPLSPSSIDYEMGEANRSGLSIPLGSGKKDWFDFYVKPSLLDTYLLQDNIGPNQITSLYLSIMEQIQLVKPVPSSSTQLQQQQQISVGQTKIPAPAIDKKARLLRLAVKCAIVLVKRYHYRLLSQIVLDAQLTPTEVQPLIMEQIASHGIRYMCRIYGLKETEALQGDSKFLELEKERFHIKIFVKSINENIDSVQMQHYATVEEKHVRILEDATKNMHQYLPQHIVVGEREYLIEIFEDLGVFYFFSSKYLEALQYFERLIRIYEELQERVDNDEKLNSLFNRQVVNKLIPLCRTIVESKDSSLAISQNRLQEETIFEKVERLKNHAADEAERRTFLELSLADIAKNELTVDYRFVIYSDLLSQWTSIDALYLYKITACNVVKELTVLSLKSKQYFFSIGMASIFRRYPLLLSEPIVQIYCIYYMAQAAKQKLSKRTIQTAFVHFLEYLTSSVIFVDQFLIFSAIYLYISNHSMFDMKDFFTNTKDMAERAFLENRHHSPWLLANEQTKLKQLPEELSQFVNEIITKHSHQKSRGTKRTYQEMEKSISPVTSPENAAKKIKEESLYAKHLLSKGDYKDAAQTIFQILTQLNESNVDPSYEYDVIIIKLALSTNKKGLEPIDSREVVHTEEFAKLGFLMQQKHLPTTQTLSEILKHTLRLNDWIFLRDYFRVVSNSFHDRDQQRVLCTFAMHIESLYFYTNCNRQSKRGLRDSLFNMLDYLLDWNSVSKFKEIVSHQQQQQQQQQQQSLQMRLQVQKKLDELTKWSFFLCFISCENYEFLNQFVSLLTLAIWSLRNSIHLVPEEHTIQEELKSVALGECVTEEMITSSLSMFRDWAGHEVIIESILSCLLVKLLDKICSAKKQLLLQHSSTIVNFKQRDSKLFTLLGAMLFEDAQHVASIKWQLEATRFASNWYENDMIAMDVLSNAMIHRMLASLANIPSHKTTAPILFQFLNQGFDKRHVGDLKSLKNIWLDYFYDISLLELLLYIAHWNKDTVMEKAILNHIEKPELNINYPLALKTAYINRMKCEFLKKLEISLVVE